MKGILPDYSPGRPGGQGGATEQERVSAAVVFLSAAAGPGPRAAPYGAARVASALKADRGLAGRIGVEILEAGPDEGAAELASRAIAALGGRAGNGGLRIAGLSLYSWNSRRLLAAAAALKAASPETLVVAGGPVATAEPDRILAAHGGSVDAVVVGEGERAMAELVAKALAGDPPRRAAIRSPLVDPASLPSPWLDGTLDPGRWGGAAVELTRGCPYRCAFCFESKGEGRLRRFPLDAVGRELERFSAAGVEEVFVLDPTFNANPKRMAEAVKAFRERGRGLRFVVELRAESLDREQARLLSTIDCSVQIGLQSSDPEVLRQVDRAFDPADFRRKAALLDREGVVWGLDLIYGLPGDTLAGFKRSLDYALGLGPNHVDVFRLAVLPGTALRDRAAALGLAYGEEAPYLVRSTPSFGDEDLAVAEDLAESADLLYNRGRAVSWFGAVARLAKARPTELIAGFAEFLRATGRPEPSAGHLAVEGLCVRYVEEKLGAGGAARRAEPTRAGAAAGAAVDLIRASGAWTRALADGEATEVELGWDPEELLDYAGAGIPAFVAAASPSPGRWVCAPGPHGPEFKRSRKAR